MLGWVSLAVQVPLSRILPSDQRDGMQHQQASQLMTWDRTPFHAVVWSMSRWSFGGVYLGTENYTYLHQ